MKRLRGLIAEEFSFFLSCPVLLWQLFFLYLPLALLVLYSFCDYSESTHTFTFTLKYYRDIFSAIYFRVFLNSLSVALATTVVSFFIAYPVAYFLALKVRKNFRTILLFSLILPSWTSLIVQIYAWMFLLDKNSFLNQFLYWTGLLSPSVNLTNSYFSVIVGMVSVYLPFMILPIFTVLERMDKRLLEAAADLGAGRFDTLRRVIFPQSLPGVYAGFVLVFLPSFGEFAVPTLLGGGKTIFLGNIIVNNFLISRDWRAGAALALVMVSFPVSMLFFGYCLDTIHKTLKRVMRKLHADFMKDV
ncbi:ABC transporter permease [Candidatus Babeliales bacterium]|nr:ABC transporter permease [Candidatus Babeliales bacterium]